MRKVSLQIGCALGALALATAATPAAAITLLEVSGVYANGGASQYFDITTPGTFAISWFSSTPYSEAHVNLSGTREFKLVEDDGTVAFDDWLYMSPILPYATYHDHNNFRLVFTHEPNVDQYSPPHDGYQGERYTVTTSYGFALHVNGAASGTPYYLKVASVPEPATWSLMIGGFFGMGSILRRRRSGTNLQAA